jgi:ADP-L-glycero-D-manno-heptose 6-epimerase
MRGIKFSQMMLPEEFSEIAKFMCSEKKTVVIHLGACSDTQEEDENYVMQNNFRYTVDLYESIRDTGALFVYASSAATYGGLEGVMDDSSDIRSFLPLNAYAMSKQLVDEYFLNKGYLNDVAGLKYFNVYGPHEEHKGRMISMVYRGWQQVKETSMIKLFSSDRKEFDDGGQRRDFISVMQAVEGTIAIASQDSERGLFNLGSGKSRTWNDLARAIFVALGCEENITYIDMPSSLKGKYQYFTEAKVDRIERILPNWSEATLEEGVKLTVEYFEGLGHL